MRYPLIALLTDFGLADGYVASMKGVLLSLAPKARIIDIAHDVSSQNIQSAAFVLWSCYKYFPKGTIFVCVVDPGVGTERNIIALQGNGYTFLAPDNGLLKFVLGSISKPAIITVSRSKYFLKTVSNTFHGRDIFAPVAAQLANGKKIRHLGQKVIPKTTAHVFQHVGNVKNHSYCGEVIHIDHFGNIITDFMPQKSLPNSVECLIGTKRITQLSQTYHQGPTTRPFLIVGSSGLIEISLKNGNASKKIHATIRQSLRLLVH